MAGIIAEVNWLAVVVGGIIHMVVGFAWYGPLFGNVWMRLRGMTREDAEAPPPAQFLFVFIGALVASLALALFVETMRMVSGSMSAVDGAVAGALVAIGFVATSSFTDTVYEDEPTGVWLIFAGYHLVALILAGIVLAVWT